MDSDYIDKIVGRWRLRRHLGSGGLGDVYLAERIDGIVNQSGALKILRRADFSPAEVDILRSFRHPNIAMHLDDGVTEDGRSYLVMEYVDGLAITDYADQMGLSIDERLALFLQVCRAIEHLHTHLVAHLDLKPENILVTAKGQVNVVDFENARQLADRNTECPMSFSGPYASPELAAGDPKTSQPADIYALGAVLYELLCGHEPFNPFLGAGELERQISEEMPRPPSERVNQTKLKYNESGKYSRIEPDRIAEMRRLRQASDLRNALSGNLDRVSLFALRKDPSRRYKAVAHFARDIGMLLDGKTPPIAKSGDPMFAALQTARRRQFELLGATAILGASLSFLALFDATKNAGSASRQLKSQCDRASQNVLAAMRSDLRSKLAADGRYRQSLATLDAALRTVGQLPAAKTEWDRLDESRELHQQIWRRIWKEATGK